MISKIYHACEEMNFVKVNKKLIKFAAFLVAMMLVQIGLNFLFGPRMLNLSVEFVKFISKCFVITLSLLINTSILICVNTIRSDIKKELDGKYKFFQLEMIAVLFVILVFVIYAYSLYTRKNFYFWDYANYYKIQNNTSQFIHSGNGIISIIRYIASSLYYEDYNNFLCIIFSFLFELLPNTGVESYIFIYVINGVLPLIYVIFLFILKMLTFWNTKRYAVVTFFSLTAVCCCPLFYNSAILGQPDVTGLIFVFIIFGLLIDYSFEYLDYGKLACLFLSTLYLFIVRRWYMFLVIGFYVSYVIVLSIKLILLKDNELRRNIVKNVIKFGILSIVLILIILFPLLKKIMGYDYATNYAFYNKGGTAYEIKHQIMYLGKFYSWLIILGVIIGGINRRTRKLTAIMTMTMCLSAILFNRIQNMATHQSYILLAEYFVLIFILIYNVFEFRVERMRQIYIQCVKGTLGCLLFVMFALSITLSLKGNCKSDLFSNLSLKPVHRIDYWDILSVYNYLDETVEEGEVAYIIASSGTINAEIFRNVKLPAVSNKIASGCAPSGTGRFDVKFFDAKYIITCDPFEDLVREEDSITKKLSNITDEMIAMGRVQLVKTFETKTGHNFYCYERVSDTTIDDVYLAEKYLAEEMEKYPTSYTDVFESYLEKFQ